MGYEEIEKKAAEMGLPDVYKRQIQKQPSNLEGCFCIYARKA